MPQNKTVFLTGHRGFVGYHLLPKLHDAGYQVEWDMRYYHSQKWFCVIHLAAVTHTNPAFDPELIESNFIYAKEIFKNPSRIIFASSCSAMNNTNPYSASKLYAEHLGLIHGNALGLRFFNIYGENNNKGIVKYLMDCEDGQDIVVRGPGLVRDYVYVDDVVNTILFHLDNEWIKDDNLPAPFIIGQKKNVGVVDVGTGIGTSTIELVNKYMELSGKTFSINETPSLPHEPECVVSSNPLQVYYSLEGRLSKMINAESDYQIH